MLSLFEFRDILGAKLHCSIQRNTWVMHQFPALTWDGAARCVTNQSNRTAHDHSGTRCIVIWSEQRLNAAIEMNKSELSQRGCWPFPGILCGPSPAVRM
jgi:hypothetical protein